MIQAILEFLFQTKGDAMMAFAPALIGIAASLAQTGYGIYKEGQERKAMATERKKWNADNEALFNKDYYSDYTQRADSQHLIKSMRDEMKKQTAIDQNTAVVTGATPEAVNAGKEQRNQAMSKLYGGLAAQGQLYKDNAQNRYVARKQALQGMEYDTMNQNAQSANNMIYNGIKGVAGTDWASIVGGGSPQPLKGSTGANTTVAKKPSIWV